MKKNIFPLLLLLAIQVHAEEQKIHVILKSGSRISISVQEQPKIVFDDGVMYVGNESLLACNVAKYVICTDELLEISEAAIGKMLIDGSEASEGRVSISNYDGEAIRLISPNGIEMPCKTAITDGTAKIDFSALPAGVYILYVGKEKVKIQKQ